MSIFTMENVNAVMASKTLEEAKKIAMEVVKKDETAKPVTKSKAMVVIQKARQVKDLGFAMSSWILAHPSEGLKVVKVMV